LTRWLPILFAGAAALSCQELAVTAVDIASIEIRPGAPTIPIGETMRLTARLIDGEGNELAGRTVSWSSTNGSIASVDGSGVVTGHTLGSATITASAEGRTGQTDVTVTRRPVSTVEVLPPAVAARLGDRLTLQAIVHTNDGSVVTDRPVVWSSQAPAVATVDGSGNVSTLSAGTATIVATAEGESGQSVITVAPSPVATVEVQPPTAAIGVGDSIRFQAVLRASDGGVLQNRLVTWTTGDPSVISLASTGWVHALQVGSATVSATSEGRTGQATISVAPPSVARVVLSPASVTVRRRRSTSASAWASRTPGRSRSWGSTTAATRWR
jgi:uncharacterized protein YjdB